MASVTVGAGWIRSVGVRRFARFAFRSLWQASRLCRLATGADGRPLVAAPAHVGRGGGSRTYS